MTKKENVGLELINRPRSTGAKQASRAMLEELKGRSKRDVRVVCPVSTHPSVQLMSSHSAAPYKWHLGSLQ